MHMINTYESLRSKLEREVEDINKNEFTEQSVDLLHKVVSSLYKLNCLIENEENHTDEGHSNGYYSNGHSYRMWPYYMGMDGGNSRNNFRYSQDRGWNGGGGYSRDNARQKMIHKLETLKDDTMSEYERKAINNCIEDISRQ